YASNNVTILAGSGDGGFGYRSDWDTAVSPNSVVIRELNGDGGPDFIVSCSTSGAGSVLLRPTDGGYPLHTQYSAGTHPQQVVLGDINGDGKPDLVTADVGSSAGASLLLGNGDGSFGSPQLDFGTGSGLESVAIGDLNHDGMADLVFANSSNQPPSVGVL